jgi:hypothetical protein
MQRDEALEFLNNTDPKFIDNLKKKIEKFNFNKSTSNLVKNLKNHLVLNHVNSN